MSSSNEPYAYYRLKGPAKKAAKALIKLEDAKRSDHPVSAYPKRNVANIRDSNLAQREIMDRIKEEKPELISMLGLDTPAIQITRHANGYPRAYNEFPHISVLELEGKTEYFMLCPIDYKGGNHKPEHAEKVDGSNFYPTDFGELVYKGKGIMSPPLLTQNKAGTKTPADFNPDIHNFRLDGIEDYTYKVFIAGGASLECVKQFIERTEALEATRRTITTEIKAIAERIPQDALLGAKDGDKISATCCFSTNEQGRPEVWVSFQNENKKSDPYGAHPQDKNIVIKDNDYFLPDDYNSGSFRIIPNRSTAEGRALARLFDGLGTEPDLGQYWQLWNPTAPNNLKGTFHSRSKEGVKVPKLETVRGVHYLIYLVDEKAEKDSCNPPGSIPVSTAEYLWLKDDIKDESQAIRPADPPPEIAHLRPVKTAATPTPAPTPA